MHDKANNDLYPIGNMAVDICLQSISINFQYLLLIKRVLMKGLQQTMVGFCVALDERSVWGVCARHGGERLQKVEGGVEGRVRARGRGRAGCPFSHMGPASTTPGSSLDHTRPRNGRPARERSHLCAVPSMPEGHWLKLSGRKH